MPRSGMRPGVGSELAAPFWPGATRVLRVHGPSLGGVPEHRHTRMTQLDSTEPAPSGAEVVITTALDGTITSCTDAAAHIFGYQADELVGRELPCVLPVLRGGHAVYKRLREGETTDDFLTVGSRRDGEEIAVSVTLIPVVGPARAPVGASLTARPVGRDELAWDARARLAAIIDASDDAMITHTLGGIITSWNAAAERMFGYVADEAIGQSTSMLVAPQRRPEEERILARLHGGEDISQLETVCVTKSGDEVEVALSISPLRDAHGRIVGASRVARDISKRGEVEEARAWLAAIVDSSDDAIVSKSLDGIITSWNRGAERMFGYTAEEAIGAPILIIIPPERRDEEKEVLASVRRGEKVDHYATVRVRKDGAPVHVSLTVSPVRDERGRIIGASKIARDISEHKRAEEERARMLHEAQEANRAKDQFLATLGHELRNPLGAIMSAFYLLEQTGAQDPTTAHVRSVGLRQGRQLARLVDDLLDIGRVMGGKIVVRLEPIDLGEVVRTHLATLRAGGKLDAHEVTVEASPVTVCGDGVRLEQIVSNLVSNALRYTPAGRRVRVSVERLGAQAVLQVEDEGVGIGEDDLPHIFELFVQSKRTAAGSQGGLGIGLALVRRLTAVQGGSVEASSEGIGRGSRFVVRLPAIETPVASPEQGRRAASATRARRILIVEDHEDAREMLRILLERSGHEIYEAADGREGVEAALQHRPEVALVDVGLPKLDGYEVAREIRAKLGESVRLVAVTGYGTREDHRRAMHAGFDHHIRKPIDLRELEKILADDASAPEARA